MTCCQIIAKKNSDKYKIRVADVKKSISNLGEKIIWKINCHLEKKLTKIHRMLKFKQSNWIKIYVDFNTEKGQKMLLLVLNVDD